MQLEQTLRQTERRRKKERQTDRQTERKKESGYYNLIIPVKGTILKVSNPHPAPDTPTSSYSRVGGGSHCGEKLLKARTRYRKLANKRFSE